MTSYKPLNIRSVLLAAVRLLGIFIIMSVTAMGLAVQEDVDKASILIFAPVQPQPLGQWTTVTFRLSDGTGKAPLINEPIVLYLNGERMRRTYTDNEGIATVRTSRSLPAGRHQLEAIFEGNSAYRGAQAIAPLTVHPTVLTVKTTPPSTGVNFSLDGQIFSTGEDGIAQINVGRSGTYRLEVLPWNSDQPGIHVTFDRWNDNTFVPYRDVSIPREDTFEVGLEVSYLVNPTFIELTGRAVPPERITSMTFKSSHGQTHVLDGAQPVWLQANRVLRRLWGLEAREIRYVLESVIIDESNVVNRGQQRFSVEPNSTWTIETLLYYARFRAIDAVFGFSLGEGITLEYPNGRIEALTFGPEGEIEVGPLARGLYKAQVTGASGMAPPTPIALSRDQDVELKVLSRLDMGVGLALGMIFALSLLFYGRPYLLGFKRAKRSASTSSMGWAGAEVARVSNHSEHRPYRRR